jgi:hypothetical protein
MVFPDTLNSQFARTPAPAKCSFIPTRDEFDTRARLVSAWMTPEEEPGLLGNLPRSRPGTRSDKRAGSTGAKPKAKRSQAAKPAAKSTRAAKPRKPAPTKPKPAAREPAPTAAKAPPAEPASPPASGGSNPLESAVKVAGAGLRVAEGVTREVLKRLPRP